MARIWTVRTNKQVSGSKPIHTTHFYTTFYEIAVGGARWSSGGARIISIKVKLLGRVGDALREQIVGHFALDRLGENFFGGGNGGFGGG
jgi:hypothetical protein